MTLDDRMRRAFNERIQTLETTMISQEVHGGPETSTDDSVMDRWNPFRGAGPLLLMGVGAIAVVFGFLSLRDAGTKVETAGEDNNNVVITDGTTTTTTTAPTTLVPVVVESCGGARYSFVFPAEWNNKDCEVFSPFDIPGEPGEREYRPEIDVAFTQFENYGESLARIQADLDVVSFTSIYLNGLNTTIFTLAEEWYAAGERTVYVVDMGDGVFFASANELIDTEPVSDLNAHYLNSVAVLHEMMANAELEFVDPGALAIPYPVEPLSAPIIWIDCAAADHITLVDFREGVGFAIDWEIIAHVYPGGPGQAPIVRVLGSGDYAPRGIATDWEYRFPDETVRVIARAYVPDTRQKVQTQVAVERHTGCVAGDPVSN